MPPKKAAFAECLGVLLTCVPVMLGYLPLSLTYGVLALSNGFSPFNTLWMNVAVYAGSSQIAGINMMLQGANFGAIVATVFVINSRHLLMSAVLAPQLGALRGFERLLFAYTLTDESFAMHSVALREGRVLSKVALFTVNFSLWVAWMVGTLMAFALPPMPQAMQEAIGLDYSVVAMFAILLVLIVRTGWQIAAALLGGMVAVGVRASGLVGWDIMVGAIVGATLTLMAKRYVAKSRQRANFR